MTQPLTRPVLVCWIAGILMGTGVGLIIGRSLPADSALENSAAGLPTATRGDEGLGLGSPGSLFDPRHFPGLPGNSRDTDTGIDARNTSTPVEPRLLPEGEASPVTRHDSTPNFQGELAPVGNQQSTRGPRTSHRNGTGPTDGEPPREALETSRFRRELQEQAPEFSPKALDEIERIRQSIEIEETQQADSPRKKSISRKSPMTPASQQFDTSEPIEVPIHGVDLNQD